MARPDNNSPRKELSNTHQKAEVAAGKGSTGRDSRFELARSVQLQNAETK
jgi:hypothetical protein